MIKHYKLQLGHSQPYDAPPNCLLQTSRPYCILTNHFIGERLVELETKYASVEVKLCQRMRYNRVDDHLKQ